MSLYIKNKKGKFVPIDISSVLGKDMNNKLVIIRVGSDEQPASMNDLDLTTSSFAKADVINDLDNVSVIITPYQIDIDLADESSIGDKSLCVQIKSGDDLDALDDITRSIYNKLNKKYSNITILPTPIKIKEYRQVKDTIKRCRMRKKRRSRF